MEVSGHHNILTSIQGKIFLDCPAEWLADISLGMMEKYPRAGAINLAKINFGNALFFRDGECRTNNARNLLSHEKNNSSKRRRIKEKRNSQQNDRTNLLNGDFYSESEKKVN